jgi:1-phosphatidylinositol phosphodiesterase
VGFNFGDVCNTCNVWLQANPNECILMQIKRECVELPPTCATDPGNTLTFEGVFDKYMQQFGSFFYLMDSIPTLGDVRSKIVLVRRFDTTNQSNHGLSPNPWKDNATFSVSYTAGNGDQVTFQVQDEYQYADDRTKLRAINALLAQASADSNDTFYINFTSAATTPPFGDPAGIAEGIQLELYPDLAKIFANRLGVLMLDFPDRFIPNNGLVERIIGLNDGLKTHSQATDRNSALTAAAG